MYKRSVRPTHRQLLAAQRIGAIRLSAPFGRQLYAKRRRELIRAVNGLMTIPYNQWLTNGPEQLEQTYLNDLMTGLYRAVGVPAARSSINNFLGRKADSDMWEDIIERWIANNAGKKIKILTTSYKQWFQGLLKEAMADPSVSIETVVQNLYSTVVGGYSELMEWQVRRIIQTETMTSLSVASSESIKALGVPFLKQWVTSGNNTREWHAVMEGVVVEENELFVVNGEYMEYPTDDSNGATAPNIINCSCGVMRIPKE